jgi:uncharacterized membrane protein YfhO
LFVSENFHPAWHATVDGQPARVIRAQHALIAVPLPAGARSIELVFSAPGFRRGEVITLLALLLVLATVAADVVRQRAARATKGPVQGG